MNRRLGALIIAIFAALTLSYAQNSIDVPSRDVFNLSTLNASDPEQLRETLQAILDQAAHTKEDTDVAINNGWILITSTLIFFMQVGFTSLEAGSVAWKRSVPDIIIKNVATTAIVSAIWWFIGFGFAFGNHNGRRDTNPIIGDSYFAKTTQSSRQEDTFSFWFFQLTFASASCTIVSGAVAERTRLSTYGIFTIINASLIYPIITHWAWSNVGWLSPFNPEHVFLGHGYIDFAGSGVVHLTGGTAAFFMAYFVGPRKNRFTDTWKRRGISLFNSQDQSWVALGTFFLWFGWYGFNGGSTLLLTNGSWAVSSLVFVNTTLSGVFAGLSCLTWSRAIAKEWDLNTLCNGLLGGLVAITAGCAVVETWAAVIIGLIAGTVFFWGSVLLVKIKVDDPVDACPLHLFNGAWGVIAVGLFASREHLRAAYGVSTHYGLFMGGGGQQLAIQLIALVSIFAWSAVITTIFASIASRLKLLRMSAEKEQKHYEDHLFANKAEEGFASVVTFNKKKAEGKTVADINAPGDDKESGEELPDLGSSDETDENDKSSGNKKSSSRSVSASGSPSGSAPRDSRSRNDGSAGSRSSSDSS